MRRTCNEADCPKSAFGRGLCQAHYHRARYHGTLPTMPPSRPCLQCGQDFSSRKWNAEYCSRSCNDAARNTRRRAERSLGARPCTCCGSHFSATKRTSRFCSIDCGQRWHNAQVSKRRVEERLAARLPCKGCKGAIPAGRRANALYCSEECKRRSVRHQTYGLTKAELDLLLVQHDQCAICRTRDWGKKGPQVDHCHRTGKVRGILCINCNNGLGRFSDDTGRLRAAVRYLRQSLR